MAARVTSIEEHDGRVAVTVEGTRDEAAYVRGCLVYEKGIAVDEAVPAGAGAFTVTAHGNPADPFTRERALQLLRLDGGVELPEGQR